MTRSPARPTPPPDADAGVRRRRAFTLAELLVVIGLITMLSSLLLPVVGRARAAARAVNCISNLRQMGTAWTMYTATNRGHLMSYAWRMPSNPALAWYAYWPGILDQHAVRGNVLICPAANEPNPSGLAKGYGTTDYAWTGRFGSNGSAIKLNAMNYRDGSYGVNRFLTAGNYGFGENGLANKITAVRNPSDVPLFMDCLWVDALPENGSEAHPVDPPPNLRGDLVYPGAPGNPTPPEHWNFLLARHGRGINVCMADGSARWVRLEETYMLTWRSSWVRYRIPLPSN
jgi:prepilin-type processing-associated H-X9-DG protein